MSAELGNVTPYIVAPGGRWSRADMKHHADNIVAGASNDGGSFWGAGLEGGRFRRLL